MGFGSNSTVVYATANGLEVTVVDVVFGVLVVFTLVRLYQHYCKGDAKPAKMTQSQSTPGSAAPSRYPFHLRALAFTCEYAVDFLTLVMDFVLKFLGPMLVLLCVGLILFVTYSYFVDVLPVAFVTFGSPYTEVLTVIGLFWLFNIFFNYFAVQLVGPGHPPPAMPSDVVDKLWRDPDLNPKKRQHTEMDHRYCMKCSVIKPMRTHHCSVCRRCVLKMDHHCPWVNSCVGYKNMRYFYLFLFYLSSGALFFIAMSTHMLVAAFTGNTQSDRYVLAAVMCLSASLASGVFLAWNTYLVFSNQTTIEFYGNYFENSRARNTTHRNPYFLEPFRNARQIFGDGHILTWFLPSLRPPPGDGFIFPLKDDDEPNAALQTVRVDDQITTKDEKSDSQAPPKPSPIRYFSASLMPPASQGGAGYELQESDILKQPARPPADPRDVDLMPKLLQMRASHVAQLSRSATATASGAGPAATSQDASAVAVSNDDHDM